MAKPLKAPLPEFFHNFWDLRGGQDYLFPVTEVPSPYVVAMGPSGLSERFPILVAGLPPPRRRSGASFIFLPLGGLGWPGIPLPWKIAAGKGHLG